MTSGTVDQGAKAGGSTRGPRSPNFPAISLQDALGKVRILYERDKRNPVRVRTILHHLGFGENLSGSSARVISALKQFGLLDESDEQYRVTEAAYRILTLSDTSPERIDALQAAAKKPAIYREILASYQDGLPSDAAMRDALILRKFNPASVDTFIRVFKASISFAKLTPGEYSSDERAHSDEPETPLGGLMEARVESAPIAQPSQVWAVGSPAIQPHQSPAGVAREVFALGDGVVTLEWPANLDAESLAEVEDWLNLVLRKLKRLKAKKPVDHLATALAERFGSPSDDETS